MSRKSFTSLVVVWIAFTSVSAQEWGRYVPEKGRKATVKQAVRLSGMGAAVSSGQQAYVLWVSDPVARAMVSNMVDRERLSEEEAETRYKSLRPDDGYIILIFTKFIGTPKPMRSPRASEAADPLTRGELFIQRAADRKSFSKGELLERSFDVDLGLFSAENSYIISFPKKNRSNEMIARDINDKLEVQFSLGAKQVILDYKIKDLVSRLEDL